MARVCPAETAHTGPQRQSRSLSNARIMCLCVYTTRTLAIRTGARCEAHGSPGEPPGSRAHGKYRSQLYCRSGRTGNYCRNGRSSDMRRRLTLQLARSGKQQKHARPQPPLACVVGECSPLEVWGDHVAACPRSGVLRAWGGPLERATARVCREAGATVATNVLVRDLNLDASRLDEPQLSVALRSSPTIAVGWLPACG